MPIGHLPANGGSRIVALVNLTGADVLVLFSAGGTQYDIPREYKHVPGVNLHSVLLPAST